MGQPPTPFVNLEGEFAAAVLLPGVVRICGDAILLTNGGVYPPALQRHFGWQRLCFVLSLILPMHPAQINS